MSVWSRACVPVTHFILLPLGPTSPLTTWRQRMPCMHARTACTAYSTGLEGRRTKGETLCPCHVSPSPTLLATGSYQCDCNRGVSPLFSFCASFRKKLFPWVRLTKRGSCMHSHSHWQRLDQLFSIIYPSMLGPMVALSERVSSRRLGYYVAPHFAPGRRGNKKPCTINMIELWLHSASRNRPLSLGKPVLSFLGPG